VGSGPGGGVHAGVVADYLAGLNAGDVDAVLSCVDEQFANEHPSDLGTDVTGAVEYRERLGPFLAEFAHLVYEAEDVIVDGGKVVVPYRMHATWQAPDGTGRPFSLRGVFLFTVAEDRITRRVDYWDGMAFSRQVGLG
jgi:ketosteroid isomerase-like protein